ncbi:MAG: hypothetical protein IJC16_03205 [Rikenellaceae bacterium]|nr:hypothetical protein [Rikenellaceae bacterium]
MEACLTQGSEITMSNRPAHTAPLANITMMMSMCMYSSLSRIGSSLP